MNIAKKLTQTKLTNKVGGVDQECLQDKKGLVGISVGGKNSIKHR